MSISMLYPLLYLLFGIAIGKLRLPIKKPLASFLSKIIIPLVIIFNIATYQQGVFLIMLWLFLMMAMLLLGRKLYADPVQNLCFFYLNIGWLGLPIASSIFGETAAVIMIAAYIGSSLFGNTIGAGLLVQHSPHTRVKQWLTMPPLWALSIGLACMPWGQEIQHYGQNVYALSKFLMSFLGMAILGIWLAETSLTWQAIRAAIPPFLTRLGVVSLLMTLFILFAYLADIPLVKHNPAVFYLIGFLPPAANIVVLETHYQNTGRSALAIASGTCVSMLALGIFVVLYQILYV